MLYAVDHPACGLVEMSFTLINSTTISPVLRVEKLLIVQGYHTCY